MRGFVAGTSAFCFRFARMHDGFEKRTGRQDHGTGSVERITGDADACDLVAVCFDRFDSFLTECQILLQFDPILHFELICLFVGLRARAVHGWPFATVQHPEMNPGGVDHTTHFAAERIDFADNLSLGDSPDGRIAAHLCDGVAIHRQQCRFRPEPRRCEGGFGPRMTGTNHDHIEIINTLK